MWAEWMLALFSNIMNGRAFTLRCAQWSQTSENAPACSTATGLLCWQRVRTETRLEAPARPLPHRHTQNYAIRLPGTTTRHTQTHTHASGWTWHPNESVATPNCSFWDLDAYPVLIWTLFKTPDLLQPSPALENLLSITHIWHSLLWWSYFIFQVVTKESPLFTVCCGWDTYSDLWVLKLL